LNIKKSQTLVWLLLFQTPGELFSWGILAQCLMSQKNDHFATLKVVVAAM
jgi:hypothetical protein